VELLKYEEREKIGRDIDVAPANREIKDGVFKRLFEKPENAVELYYALTGIKCNPSEIEIITLTTTISGKLKNDLAFVVRGKTMVMGEHQSTPSKNMPLRILMYLGQLVEKWIRNNEQQRFLYGSSLYKIPTPEFVVFYNGLEERPEKETLKISNAFEHTQDRQLGYLELEVPVYNINKGMNEELFAKGEKLRHYSEFIAKVREFQKVYDDFNKAVEEAVHYCIAHGILVGFLKEEGGNIVSILSTYDEEVAKRVFAEEKIEAIALGMLLEGDTAERVSRITNLPLEIVERLRIGVLANSER